MLSLKLHQSDVHALHFAHGGAVLASVGGRERRVSLTDLASTHRRFLAPARSSIEGLVVSPDGERLVTFERQAIFRLQTAEEGTVESFGKAALRVPRGSIVQRHAIRKTIRPRLRWVDDDQLVIANATRPPYNWPFERRTGPPEGWPGVGGWNLRCIDPLKGKSHADNPGRHFRHVIQFDTQCVETLAVLGEDGWRSESMSPSKQRVIELCSLSGETQRRLTRLPAGFINGLRSLGDERFVLTHHRHVLVGDAELGDWEVRHDFDKDRITALERTPDRSGFLVGTLAGEVCWFDAHANTPPVRFAWEIGPIRSLAVSPDGQVFAAGGDRQVVLWDRE